MKETTYTGDGTGLMPQTPTEMVGEYIEYAKSIGVDIKVEKSDTPDTFEKIFGDMYLHFRGVTKTSTLKEGDRK